ncbi:DsbA family protein [Microbacterium aurantiacum]|uniref:DsbA family protein n=1 Tax=Microbacterium aurantiacum TaxID=162393 RepID=UPI001F24C070|nr:DsbA family protein [Microbacterium aurantiacum]
MTAQNTRTAADPAAAAKRRRRQALRNVAVATGSTVLVAGFLVGVFFAFGEAGDVIAATPEATASAEIGDASVVVEVSGDRIRVGAPEAATTMAIWEDFACGHCREYETQIGPTVQELVAGGSLAVEYHLLDFVSDYSAVAGSAAACVATEQPDVFFTVHATLFAIRENAEDEYSAEQLESYLETAGVTDEGALECIGQARYGDWVAQNAGAARDAGITSTPTVRINGEDIGRVDAAQLRDLVAQNAG